jgi:nitrite reductase (NADH) small subunit
MKWTTLCAVDDLTEGLGKYVEIDGFCMAVFLQDGEVHVIDNACPHAGGSMSGGYIDGGCAVCPWHGWAFDLKSGALRDSFGDSEMLRVYPTRVFDDAGRKLVQVQLPGQNI